MEDKDRKNVMVACPMGDGRIDYRSMITLMRKITIDHIVDFELMAWNSLITMARNIQFSKFVNDKRFDYMFSMDSDIYMTKMIDFDQTGQSIGIVDRLIERNKDFIGALYPRKTFINGNPPANCVPMDTEEELILDGRVIEMNKMSVGFTLISRKCAEEMVNAYPELYYEEERVDSGKRTWGWAMYNTMFDKDSRGVPIFLGEDYSFCKRWADIGGKMWADTSIHLAHTGHYDYTLAHLEPASA